MRNFAPSAFFLLGSSIILFALSLILLNTPYIEGGQFYQVFSSAFLKFIIPVCIILFASGFTKLFVPLSTLAFLIQSVVILAAWSWTISHPQTEPKTLDWNSPLGLSVLLFAALFILLAFQAKKRQGFLRMVVVGQVWLGLAFGFSFGGLGKILGPLIGVGVAAITYLYWNQKLKTNSGTALLERQRRFIWLSLVAYVTAVVIISILSSLR